MAICAISKELYSGNVFSYILKPMMSLEPSANVKRPFRCELVMVGAPEASSGPLVYASSCAPSQVVLPEVVMSVKTLSASSEPM